MATIVLQAAGAFLGGAFGATGAAIGSAAGAIAGYLADRALIDSTRRYEGPRLNEARPLTAEDGAPMPRVYGTMRVGGVLIWATHFEETSQTTRQGGKGGPKVTTYSYAANAAFGLCEGPIAGIRRVWADGREIDLDEIVCRVHAGTQDQLPDPLIEAKQGTGNTPAYRGVAYAVFENFPLESYGNRLPQMQFEVLRPIGTFAERVQAVALIPGSTEFGYSPTIVRRTVAPGETEAVNRHVLFGATDFSASIDELQKSCPGLENVALVVTWFGDDLRAGECRIRPGVTQPSDSGFSVAWRVSGQSRAQAVLVSSEGNAAAYGGTPTDRSVIEAIGDLKARGLKVTLYPFVMMDVAPGNTLANPYGGIGQPAYPWRGRITCDPAPGRPETADKSAAGRAQIEAFFGNAAPGDFVVSNSMVNFTGPAGEWGYRRMVLHYARIAALAGGVDAFLIGSELRGLTTVRGDNASYPAVEALAQLAADVRSVVGPAVKLSYGADWTEYFGHHPDDGSGDVRFHLDPLWAHPAIDAVGIDNYMPLADWRDDDYAGGNPDEARGPGDPDALRRAIVAGEGFDWHYATQEDRRQRSRSPIEDGAYGKPWTFRCKDLAQWWSNPHFDRFGGVESALPTPWTPAAKPIWLTELGCPATDKGPNQPNVFPDAKSSEGAIPYSSNGGRCDLIQRRLIEAHFDHWRDDSPHFSETQNPVSPIYGGRMLDTARSYLWAWDCRPYPAFPLRQTVWADGANWTTGHWLNGRLTDAPIGELINAILRDHGLPEADIGDVDGSAAGYIVSEPTTARKALEEIGELYGIRFNEHAEGLVARGPSPADIPSDLDTLVVTEGETVHRWSNEPERQREAEAVLFHHDSLRDYQSATARAGAAGGAEQATIGISGALDEATAGSLVHGWLKRRRAGSARIAFSLPPNRRDLHPGSLVRLPAVDPARVFQVEEIDDGLVRRITGRAVDRSLPERVAPDLADMQAAAIVLASKPLVHLMDLPILGQADEPHRRLCVAARSAPWRRQVVLASPEATGFSQRTILERSAVVGALDVDLASTSGNGRIDMFGSILVRLCSGELASVPRLQLLNGANAAAVYSNAGAWEVLQFEAAEEISPDLWRLGGLLRGQGGTEDAMRSGAPAGAAFVLLDAAVQPAGLLATETGLDLNWRIGPVNTDYASDLFEARTVSGGLRAALPLSPVHLRADRLASGDIRFSWIRRSRVHADSWEGDDVPLGEETEAYLVEIRDDVGTILRQARVGDGSWTYAQTFIDADFAAPASAVISVRQVSARAGPGLPARLAFTIPA